MNEAQLSEALVAIRVLIAQWEVMDQRSASQEAVIALRRLTERYMSEALSLLIGRWEEDARLKC